MKLSHWLDMTKMEPLSLFVMTDVTVPSGRGEAGLCAVEADISRAMAGLSLPEIANALTAIMLQAEATRRHALLRGASDADVTPSCDRIVANAKRVWQLIADAAGPEGPC